MYGIILHIINFYMDAVIVCESCSYFIHHDVFEIHLCVLINEDLAYSFLLLIVMCNGITHRTDFIHFPI
jgi:hypothetical protein